MGVVSETRSMRRRPPSFWESLLISFAHRLDLPAGTESLTAFAHNCASRTLTFSSCSWTLHDLLSMDYVVF